MAKKITLEKNEGVAEAIDRILEQEHDDVTVVVPKGSAFGKSPRNFALLRREIDAGGKSVTVESPDQAIMAFAEAAGLAGNAEPIVKMRGAGEVSDIVSPRQANFAAGRPEEELPTPSPIGSKRRKIAVPIEPEAETEESGVEEDGNEDAAKETPPFFTGTQDRFFKDRTLEETENDEDEGKGSVGKWIGISLLILIVIGAGLWGFTVLFGKVAIAINFTKTPWQYQGSFTADKAASSINAAADVIPAQVFSISKNATQLFPASSEQDVSIKATGALTIYNAYSSAPQTLVATTRFVTPAGQIFRLVNQVIVPGAQVTNGQIVPSSVNAEVVADQAGPSYNVGPVAKLTVPGFANTAKFDGFYGTIASGTAGGFVGQKAVPTASDISSAKARMTSLLQSDLSDGLTATYPNNFKILPGATSVQVTTLTVNTSTDANGNFSVFGAASLSAIGFDETAFKNFLLSLAQSTEPSSTFNALTLTYSNATPNFTNGTLGFTVSAQGSLEPWFVTSTFEDMIAGESIASARAAVAGLPQLANGSISVWPTWLSAIPSNPDRIQMDVN